jgi:hypothetical protein
VERGPRSAVAEVAAAAGVDAFAALAAGDVLRRQRIDPAVVSPPPITTPVNGTGLVICSEFEFARRVRRLQPRVLGMLW